MQYFFQDHLLQPPTRLSTDEHRLELGQSTAEYTLVLVVAAVAAVTLLSLAPGAITSIFGKVISFITAKFFS